MALDPLRHIAPKHLDSDWRVSVISGGKEKTMGKLSISRWIYKTPVTGHIKNFAVLAHIPGILFWAGMPFWTNAAVDKSIPVPVRNYMVKMEKYCFPSPLQRLVGGYDSEVCRLMANEQVRQTGSLLQPKLNQYISRANAEAAQTEDIGMLSNDTFVDNMRSFAQETTAEVIENNKSALNRVH